MGGYRAAIDFGTSYTVAACQAGPQTVPTVLVLVDEGRLSSAVALDNAGVVRAGPYVEEVAALAPDRVERTPKRCLDQPDVMLAGQPVQTVDLVAAVLRYARDELLRQFNGGDPDELCLTHPARWEDGDPRIERLQAAARQAGFPTVRLLPEPCAAALALAAVGQLIEVGEGELVAVYDLGGGTFDLALLSRAHGGGFELVGEPGGDQELGGEWLDDRLFERLSSRLPDDDEAALRDPDSSPDSLQWRRAGFAFRQGIRRAKERLSREVSTQIALNPPFTLDHLSLSRAELELTATPLITRSADRFDLFLQRNGRAPADLAAICLVGGSSRLTVVNRILGNRFGRPITTHGDPKAVTALGALSEIPAAAPGTKVTTSPRHSPLVGSPTDSASLAAAERSSDVPEHSAAGSPPSSSEPSSSQPAPRAEGQVTSSVMPGSFPAQAVMQQVEALYDEALAAFWTDQFDRAVELLEQVLAMWPEHPSASVKLQETRRQQQLAASYGQACAAADAGDWEQAVAGFTRASDIEPGYRDVAARLKNARGLLRIAELHAEARRLYGARQWEAVVKVGEQLNALNPDAADPEGLVTSAQAELAIAQRSRRMAEDYRAALRMLDVGAWQQAAAALERIAQIDPGYRDTPALLARARGLANESSGWAQEEADRRAQEEAELEAREMRAGSTGREEGDPAGARDQFAVLLPVRERVSGAEHPYALAARHNLAFWTGQAGDAAGARDQFAALLPVRERVSGAEDPATLNVRSNLAFWTGQAGDAAGARDQLAALLPVRKRLSGGGHPETLATRRELARWTGEAGDAAAVSIPAFPNAQSTVFGREVSEAA